MDPWLWSVDDVIQNLCYSTELWDRRKNPWLERPADLENILLSNPIDGATLLLDVNHATLKDDLGIVALQERSALLWLVDQLRGQSAQYLAHQRSVHGRNAHISNTSTSYSPFSATPRTASDELLPHVVQSPARSLLPSLENTLPPQVALLSEPHVRAGEVLIDGPRGKKRKLVLSSRTHNETPAETELPQGNSARRLSLEQGPFSDIPDHAYIGRKGANMDNIIYGEAKLGDRIDYANEEDEHDTISFFGVHSYADGRRRFFYNCLTRSMNGDTKTWAGRLIKYPYPIRLVNPKNPVSATLYSLDSIRRVDATAPDARYEPGNYETSTSEWDYLAAKYQATESDEGLPLYGDTDSEIINSDPEFDDDDPRQEVPVMSANLTTDQLGTIMDDCVAAFKQLWEETELPALERKALSIWKDGRSHLENTRAQLLAVEKRLGSIRKRIQEDDWKSETLVRRQCHSMEQTVFGIEELKFKIKLWQQSRPPLQPKRREIAKKPTPKWILEYDSEGEDVKSLPDEDSLIDDVNNNEDAVKQEQPEYPVTSHIVEPLDNADREKKDTADNIQAIPDVGLISGNSAEPIDLTMSDDDAGLEVEVEDIFSVTRAEILSWSWTAIEESGNREQLILKLLCSVEPTTAKSIVKSALLDRFEYFTGDLKLGLRYVNSTKAPGKNNEEFSKCINQARAYLCWAVVDHNLWEGNVPKDVIDGVSRSLSAKPYHDFMDEVSRRGTGLFNESDTEQESDDGKKKRKTTRKHKDSKGKDLQLAAKRRKEFSAARHLQLESSGLDDERIMINTSKSDEEEPIYINSQIASRMKPHQIEGVRFMWRELIVSESSEENQGCLLAHTMGLGKTMQAITLIATINEVLQSNNSALRRQIPRSIRKRPFRVLIICPPGLIDNWRDEFTMWLPNDGTVLYELSARVPREDRQTEILEWFNNGGILLSGMELFRRYALSNAASNDRSYDNAEEVANSQRLRRCLLDGPRIVIADEAHKLKNTSTGVGAAVMKFKTPSRVAMTGSPLANNLLDYWAMINWVAEGYLGGMAGFKASYQSPIEAGIYADSTSGEQRRALTKLQALKRIIEPKVHRADITVLSGSLPPKTEFVVKIPLTRLQTKAYQCFVESLRSASGGADTVANTRLFNWLNILALLCAHPVIFLKKIVERKAADKLAKEGLLADEKRGESPPDKAPVTAEYAANALNKVDIDVDNMGLSEDMIQLQRQMFEEEAAYVGPDSLQLSFKTRIISEIITQSLQLGDRVLIFSHYLPTLDYFERIIKAMPGVKATRLDGSVQGDERTPIVKDFNAGKYNVMLISTRAGGLGLNIPGANRVILADFHFNPSWEEQAVGRVYRMGQTKPVYVYHLVTGGTFEETIHQRTIFKRQLAFRVVDRKQPIRAASKIKDFLFLPREIPQDDVSQYFGKDTIMDRLIMMDTAVCSLSTTEVLHKESNETLTEEEMKEVDLMVRSEKLRKKTSTPTGPVSHALDQMQLDQQLRDLGYGAAEKASLGEKHPELFQQSPVESTVPHTNEMALGRDEPQGAVNIKDINPLSADIEMGGTVRGWDTPLNNRAHERSGKQTDDVTMLPGIVEAAMTAEEQSTNGA